MRSIEVVIDSLCKAVMEGKAGRTAAAEGADAARADDAGPQRRRSSRVQFRAEQDAQSADQEAATVEPAKAPSHHPDADEPDAEASTPTESISRSES